MSIQIYPCGVHIDPGQIYVFRQRKESFAYVSERKESFAYSDRNNFVHDIFVYDRILIMKVLILILFFLVIFFPIQVFAAPSLDQVNQKVCDRFEEDVSRMAAIMEELRSRKGILETRVAFGGIDDQIKSADYWITYAAEAIAYQRAQEFSSKAQLRSGLETLKGKVLRAKTEVGKALNE